MVGSACLDYENNDIHSSNKLKNKFGESVVIPTEGFVEGKCLEISRGLTID